MPLLSQEVIVSTLNESVREGCGGERAEQHTVTGLTVVPAYRVVAHFVKQARKTPEAQAPSAGSGQALDSLEQKVRQYLRSSLSALHGSYAEIGERWAVTQLGDPDLDTLSEALQVADRAAPRNAVEEALWESSQLLPRPDLSARFLLLPGDGESRLLTQVMHGVMGISLGSQATLLFFWPSGEWLSWLAYTATHEYTHLVRNHLFPRGLAGGRPVYLKTQEPETLLDAMVAEGIADVFARQIYPQLEPRWLKVLSEEEAARIWPRVRRRLRVSDPNEVRRFISGDGDRIPQWTGYCLGYRIVRSYLQRHPTTRPASLVGMQAWTIFGESDYGERELGE